MSQYRELPPLIQEELIEKASGFSTANICDGMNKLGLLAGHCMDKTIKPVSDKMRVIGTACTVDTKDGDNFPLHLAIYSCKPGYVIVVSGKAYEERAYMGDLMGGAADAIGVSGIVVDGYVRDKDGLDRIGMPVFSRGFKPASPVKKGPGGLNVPVLCGAVEVQPGDLIMGDYDGVVAVPRDRIEEVLAAAAEKVAYEGNRVDVIEEYRRCSRTGEPLPDLTPGWVKEMMEKKEEI